MSNQEHRDPQDSREEAALRRAWQQVSDELPPPELDAAIIAAARKSVKNPGAGTRGARDSTRSRNWFMQWQPLAAAATVAGLAFILLQLMPRERDVTPSIRMEQSAPVPAAARPTLMEPPAIEGTAAEPAAAERAADDSAATGPETSGQLAGSQNDDAPVLSGSAAADQQAAISTENDRANVVTPEPARAGTTVAVPKASAEGDLRTTVVPPSADSGGMGALGASVAAAVPAAEKRQRDEATSSASAWAARILALYDSGDEAGAADMLRAFRAAEPDADAYLPDSLSDWARTVK